MRSYFLALMGMLLVSCLHAEVVLTNYGNTTGFGSSLSSSESSIAWTSGYSGNFTSVKLRIYNSSLIANLSSLSLDFGLASGSFTLTNVAGTGVSISQQNFGDVTFDLGTSLAFTSSESGSLYFRLNSQTFNASANWANSTDPVRISSGWTGGATTGPTSGEFQLSATAAVPEPGTLLLGGIAALTGGTGVWWKCRKKATCKVNE